VKVSKIEIRMKHCHLPLLNKLAPSGLVRRGAIPRIGFFRAAPGLAACALLAASFAWPQQAPPQSSPTPAPAQPATPGPAQPGQTAPKPDSGLKTRGTEAVAERDPGRIVAVINGEKITAKDAAHMLTFLPPDKREQYIKGPGGLAQALQDVYLTLDFAKQAEKLHLDQSPQYQDQLLLAKAPILGQAYIQYLTTQNYNLSEADIEKAYNDHVSDYEQMKLAGIFVSYTPAGGKPPVAGKPSRTPEEAKARAEDLVKKIRGGADFAGLAKTDSDDASSAGKGGEIGPFTVGTAKQRLPQDIYPTVMALHKGEVSDPIDRKTGYWIFYMTDRAQQSFGEVRQLVLDHIHAQHASEVMEATLKQYHIQVQDNDFFSTPKPAAATPKIPSLQNPPSASPGAPAPKP
jgi:peptidyl-prolyl cis-trans isomerase C